MNRIHSYNHIIYLEPVLICVTSSSPSKIIILTEEDTAEKKVHAEQLLEAYVWQWS